MNSISIIIVTYNSENEINDCLVSITSSLLDVDYQIIIADNNSTDNTLSVIHQLDTPNINIIKNQKNYGFTKAVNQCLNLATKNYILFLNPDTILQDDSLIELTKELKNNETLGAIAPQLRYPNGNIQKSCRRFPRRRNVIYESFGLNKLFKKSKEFNYWKMGDFDHQSNSYVEQPAGAALLIPKAIFQNIGNFDERFPMFFSDVDYCKRITNAGYKIKYFADTYITHKGGASIHRNQNKMIISSHLSFWRYFNKYNKGLLNQILNLIIGLLLLVLIPVRIIINTFIKSKKIRNNNTL